MNYAVRASGRLWSTRPGPQRARVNDLWSGTLRWDAQTMRPKEDPHARDCEGCDVARSCEHNPYTAYFLAHLHTFHPCSHAPHGSRCRSACLIKTCSITGHHVSDRALSLRALTSSSLSSVSTSCPLSSSPLSWSSSSMWSKPPSTKSPALVFLICTIFQDVIRWDLCHRQ